LGFKPKVDMRKGIRKALDYYFAAGWLKP